MNNEQQTVIDAVASANPYNGELVKALQDPELAVTILDLVDAEKIRQQARDLEQIATLAICVNACLWFIDELPENDLDEDDRAFIINMQREIKFLVERHTAVFA